MSTEEYWRALEYETTYRMGPDEIKSLQRVIKAPTEFGVPDRRMLRTPAAIVDVARSANKKVEESNGVLTLTLIEALVLARQLKSYRRPIAREWATFFTSAALFDVSKAWDRTLLCFWDCVSKEDAKRLIWDIERWTRILKEEKGIK